MNKIQFRSRKEVSEFLATKGIDTTNWTEVNWLQINKGQAEIHMMATAEAMWDAYNKSTPKELKAGEWHIPFIDKINLTENWNNDLESYMKSISIYDNNLIQMTVALKIMEIKISTVMAARTSYTVVGEDQKPLSYKRMLEIHDELLAASPKHMSPFEHCARAMNSEEYELSVNGKLEWTGGQYDKPLPTDGSEGWCGNFRGFIQYRKMIPNENITK